MGVVDRHLGAVKVQHGPSLAKTTRSVLPGVCALACRYDALVTNPCRDVARISTKPKRPPTALTAESSDAFTNGSVPTSNRSSVIFPTSYSSWSPPDCGSAKRSPSSGAIWTWMSAPWKSVGQFSGCALAA